MNFIKRNLFCINNNKLRNFTLFKILTLGEGKHYAAYELKTCKEQKYTTIYFYTIPQIRSVRQHVDCSIILQLFGCTRLDTLLAQTTGFNYN